MEPSADFPDAELVKSPKHGVVFRVPQLDLKEESSSDDNYQDGYEDRKRRFVRPHSAKGPTLDLPSRVLPSKPKGVRPWSAQPRIKQQPSPSQRKLSRQTLRKPHFQAPPRSPAVSVSSEGSSLITAVGLANERKLSDIRSEESATPTEKQAKNTAADGPQSPDRWALTLEKTVAEAEEPAEESSQEPGRRSSKKHPDFDSWISGEPIDSDEYDTDLDIEEFIRNHKEEVRRAKPVRLKKKKKKEKNLIRQANVQEEKPIDPTGKAMYMDQCQVQGVAPVSFLSRHLGDKSLRMRHHYLGGNGTKPVAVALFKNTVTEVLDLCDNYIEGEGARYIGGMLRHNTFITNLNIARNFIGPEGFAAVCSMLETNTTLKTLCVSGNQLTDMSAHSLIEALKNNLSLTSLDLSDNDFGELAGVYIGGALSLNEGLLDLDLSWNSIRYRGAAALISALNKKQSLEVLDLSWNGLGESGADALKVALKSNSSLKKNQSLEVLDLSWNGLGESGADALKVALKSNSSLKVLDLTNNRLTTKSAEAMAWGLSKNTGLESLVINLNPIRDSGLEGLLKAADKHPCLQLLSMEEIAISRSNYHKIQELQSQKGLTVLHGGVGGYQRVSTATSMIKLFNVFVSSHRSELASMCSQHDDDRNGQLRLDDLKLALKEAGLRLTSKQLNIVIDELNYENKNTMNYKDILNGHIIDRYNRHRPARAFNIASNQLSINTLPDTLHRQLTVA